MQSVCTQNLRKPNTGQEGLHLPCVERSVIFSDREGIGKCVCLRLPAVAVNFDAVSASSVFLVYFYPRSWNALEGLLCEYRQPQVEVVHCRTAFLAFGDC